MGKGVVFLLVLVFLTAPCTVAIQPVKSQLTSREIYIKPDGTIVDPNPVTPIQQYGNVYAFTGDIYGRLVIEKSNVLIDGAGYSLKKSELDFAVNVGTGVDIPRLVGVNGVTLTNMEIVGFNYGITLGGENNIVSGVNITEGPDYNGVPIWVTGSNNSIRGCRITANKGYGLIVWAKGAVLSDNYIADNGHSGIYFQDRAAMLRNNTLNNNALGPFYMDESSTSVPGEPFQITSNDIDASNMVDGKPVYYWVNEQDKTIPSDAGYVVLDNCTNVNVKGLSINRNSAGRFVYGSAAISLIRTKNSVLASNILNGTGIYISYSSQDILVADNKIACGGIHSWGSNVSINENSVSASKDSGISLGGNTADAIVTKNILTGCETGINLQSSSQIRVIQNSITDCGTGISIFSSNNNVFYHNNFINNKQQVSEQHYTLQWPLDTYYQSFNNTWDGNFWSDYNGTDANGDGIGDTPYLVYENFSDHYPLMTPFAVDGVADRLPDWMSSLSVRLISPKNTTYASANVALEFTVNKQTSWLGYSLDGQETVTITGNTTLSGLSSGLHNITVYAKDEFENMGTSETIVFSIAEEPESFPTTWVVAAAATIAIGSVSLAAYHTKRKNKKQKTQT